MKPRPASTELERLNAFVGVWETEGELATESAQQPTKFRATDTYEWLPGGYFLLHRFDADMPSGKVEGIEVIGYSPKGDSYPMQSFDSVGNASAMEARLQADTWTFVGDGIRFTGGFRADGRVFAGRWESRPSEGVPWQAWMEVRLTKVD